VFFRLAWEACVHLLSDLKDKHFGQNRDFYKSSKNRNTRPILVISGSFCRVDPLGPESKRKLRKGWIESEIGTMKDGHFSGSKQCKLKNTENSGTSSMNVPENAIILIQMSDHL